MGAVDNAGHSSISISVGAWLELEVDDAEVIAGVGAGASVGGEDGRAAWEQKTPPHTGTSSNSRK